MQAYNESKRKSSQPGDDSNVSSYFTFTNRFGEIIKTNQLETLSDFASVEEHTAKDPTQRRRAPRSPTPLETMTTGLSVIEVGERDF